ncbi:MAG: hypothetical protein COA78_11225 [Blastopirellula sp.]|nr:MAG: hypothetical protein COA78_11225 [Blastopirellula sp.]
MNGVNPKQFLGGGMCREEAASAYLATMLEQSADFRELFFQLCDIPPFDVEQVEVEQELRDVTITGKQTLVFIENKIAAGSKTHGQLVTYYERAKESNSDSQVHSIYLAPSRQLGESEVMLVNAEDGEIVKAIAWTDIEKICQQVKDLDPVFTLEGVKQVQTAIRRSKSQPTRDWTDDELGIRAAIKTIAVSLETQLPQRELVPFGCELWAYGPITVYAKCVPDESSKEGSTALRVSVKYLFHLSSKKSEDKPFAKRWLTPLKANKEWNSFKIDQQNNWMIREQQLSGEPHEIAEVIETEFYNLVREIDAGVAREKEKSCL